MSVSKSDKLGMIIAFCSHSVGYNSVLWVRVPYGRVSEKSSVVVHSRRGDSKSLPNCDYMEDRKKILFQRFTKYG